MTETFVKCLRCLRHLINVLRNLINVLRYFRHLQHLMNVWKHLINVWSDEVNDRQKRKNRWGDLRNHESVQWVSQSAHLKTSSCTRATPSLNFWRKFSFLPAGGHKHEPSILEVKVLTDKNPSISPRYIHNIITSLGYKKAGAGTLKQFCVVDCWTINLLRFVSQFHFINCVGSFYFPGNGQMGR